MSDSYWLKSLLRLWVCFRILPQYRLQSFEIQHLNFPSLLFPYDMNVPIEIKLVVFSQEFSLIMGQEIGVITRSGPYSLARLVPPRHRILSVFLPPPSVCRIIVSQQASILCQEFSLSTIDLTMTGSEISELINAIKVCHGSSHTQHSWITCWKVSARAPLTSLMTLWFRFPPSNFHYRSSQSNHALRGPAPAGRIFTFNPLPQSRPYRFSYWMASRWLGQTFLPFVKHQFLSLEFSSSFIWILEFMFMSQFMSRCLEL